METTGGVGLGWGACAPFINTERRGNFGRDGGRQLESRTCDATHKELKQREGRSSEPRTTIV